ncbi:MAG: hypothetical protein IJU55_00395 [Selenomonadaceae bacterium]|nr:hypothetical protein [Selenomonadaceae bacterium]
MTFEVNLNAADTMLVEDHVKKLDVSVEEFMRRAILEAIIDDDYCLYLYEKAAKDYEKNPESIPFEELKKRWQTE